MRSNPFAISCSAARQIRSERLRRNANRVGADQVVLAGTTWPISYVCRDGSGGPHSTALFKQRCSSGVVQAGLLRQGSREEAVKTATWKARYEARQALPEIDTRQKRYAPKQICAPSGPGFRPGRRQRLGFYTVNGRFCQCLDGFFGPARLKLSTQRFDRFPGTAIMIGVYAVLIREFPSP